MSAAFNDRPDEQFNAVQAGLRSQHSVLFVAHAVASHFDVFELRRHVSVQSDGVQTALAVQHCVESDEHGFSVQYVVPLIRVQPAPQFRV